MIKYNPEDGNRTLPVGDYLATLIRVEERESKAGNPMHVLTFRAYHGDREALVTEYIPHPVMTWKLKKVARAFEKESAFEAGAYDPSDDQDRNLILTLGLEKQEGYEEKNIISAYLPKSKAAELGLSGMVPAGRRSDYDDDDDLGF